MAARQRKQKESRAGIAPNFEQARAQLERARRELDKAGPDLLGRRQAAEKGWLAAVTAARMTLRCASGETVPSAEGVVKKFKAMETTIDKGFPLTTRLDAAQNMLHGSCFYRGVSEDCAADRIATRLHNVEQFINGAEQFCPVVRKPKARRR